MRTSHDQLIIADCGNASSLLDLFAAHCKPNGTDLNESVNVGRSLVDEAQEESASSFFGLVDSSSSTAASALFTGKRKAFAHNCKIVPSNLLKSFFAPDNATGGSTFTVCRTYATHLGIQFAIQYLLGAPAVAADQILASTSGRVNFVGVRPRYFDGAVTALARFKPSAVITASVGPVGGGGGVDRAGSMGMTASTGGGEAKRMKLHDDPIGLGLRVDASGFAACAAELSYADFIRSGFDRREDEAPFRFTRNVARPLSGGLALGGTALALGCTLDALLHHTDVVEVGEGLTFFLSVGRFSALS